MYMSADSFPGSKRRRSLVNTIPASLNKRSVVADEAGTLSIILATRRKMTKSAVFQKVSIAGKSL